jgi:hypothetical protein
MLSSDEVVTITGHPVGGVCPFGLENPLSVYCDISLNNTRKCCLPQVQSTALCAFHLTNGRADFRKMGRCLHLIVAPERIWRIHTA